MKRVFVVLMIVLLSMVIFPSGTVFARNTFVVYPKQVETKVAVIPIRKQINRFEYEFINDPFLKSLVELKYYVNKVSPESTILLGEYLKTTPWYTHELARLKGDEKQLSRFEESLVHLDQNSNLVPNQKMQCYGLGVLINGMDRKYPSIGGVKNVTFVSDLVPESIRSGEMLIENGDGMTFMVVRSIEEVNVGDFGILDTTNEGHVFAVVAKKIIDGEVVLLIVSANQARDGRIGFLEVDKNNFEKVFGSPGRKNIIVRGASTN